MTNIVIGKVKDKRATEFDVFANAAASGCKCTTSELLESAPKPVGEELKDIAVTIDGKKVDATTQDINIVEVASRAGIIIPAPCYKAERKNGCCNGCVVEINGEQKFACVTAPEEDMDIIVKRDDLNEIRQKNLSEYADGVKSGKQCACSSPQADIETM